MVLLTRFFFVCVLICLVLGKASAASAPSQQVIPTSFDPTDEKACELMQSLDAVEDDVPGYLLKHTLLIDGERLNVKDQGTAHYDEIVGTDVSGKAIWFKGLEGAEADRGIYLLPVGGRIYSLHYAGDQPLYLHMIGRITSANEEVPVCLMKPNVKVSLDLALNGKHKSLCDRVSMGKLDYIPEHKFSNIFMSTVDCMGVWVMPRPV